MTPVDAFVSLITFKATEKIIKRYMNIIQTTPYVLWQPCQLLLETDHLQNLEGDERANVKMDLREPMREEGGLNWLMIMPSGGLWY